MRLPLASSAGGSRAIQRKTDGGPTRDADIEAIARDGVAGAGSSLPHAASIQRSFGSYDVSGVRAHMDGAAAGASQTLGARAYTFGDQIAFRGAADLHTAAHEAAHAVQQRAGATQKGLDGGEGDPLERHADQVAGAVVRGESAEPLLDRLAAAAGRSAAVQREPDPTAGVLLRRRCDRRWQPTLYRRRGANRRREYGRCLSGHSWMRSAARLEAAPRLALGERPVVPVVVEPVRIVVQAGEGD